MLCLCLLDGGKRDAAAKGEWPRHRQKGRRAHGLGPDDSPLRAA